MSGFSSLFTKARGAMFLSALVMPGSGQFFVQGRRVAGLFYFFCCGLTMMWLAVCVTWELVVIYGGAMWDFNQEVPRHPGWQQVAFALAATMFSWALNVLDTWIGNRLAARRKPPEPPPLPPAPPPASGM